MVRLLVLAIAAAACYAESCKEQSNNGVTVCTTRLAPEPSNPRAPYPSTPALHVALRSEHLNVERYTVTAYFTRVQRRMSRSTEVAKAPGLDWSAVVLPLEAGDVVTGVSVVEHSPAEHFDLDD